MKLSIVIICWNDWKVIENSLRSIFAGTHKVCYEVIVSDNGSTDDSAKKIRAQFPVVRMVENRSQSGFCQREQCGHWGSAWRLRPNFESGHNYA